MQDIISKKCLETYCNKVPNFNYKNKNKGLYCFEHKKDNMIDVKNKKCIFPNCNILPNFNYKNEKTRLYCSFHKLNGMVDINNINNKKCIYEKCKIFPIFNYEGKKKAIYCFEHKQNKMINIISKTCIYENCKKISVFNYEGKTKAIYCSEHKQNNMIDIKHKTCIYEKCEKQPIFNYEEETKAIYCSKHKKDNMTDVKHKKCKLCNFVRASKKYYNYCFRCFIYTFPENKIVRNYKTKEVIIANFIKDNFKNLNISYDKIIQGGCSKYRPDILIELYTHVIIIEVDENQHKNKYYIPECEIRRINNLFTDLGDRKILFIRFNPDSYKDKNNKLVKSCFEYTEVNNLPKANMLTLNPRLNILKEEIEKNLLVIPNENITIIKLFYDEI